MMCPWIRKSKSADGGGCPRYTPEDTVLPVLLYSCAQLRRGWCCCFPLCFQKHLYLTRQGEPHVLLLSKNTVPMCQFAWRGKQLCASLWLESWHGAGFLQAHTSSHIQVLPHLTVQRQALSKSALDWCSSLHVKVLWLHPGASVPVGNPQT